MTAPPTSPELQLAAGFARHVERWSLAQGAATRVAAAAARAASALCLATTEGHVCIALSDLPALADDAAAPDAASASAQARAWRQRLLCSGVVGTPEAAAAMPLVLDHDDRLYLHRHFDYEQRLARRLMRARAAPHLAPHDDALPRLAARLDALFAGNAEALGDAADWQKLATALALRGRLAIVSGGPGTGKTTTVVNLLACLLELDPDCRIALCAPTGKAAARMTEAIRQRAAQLPEALRGRLPAESFTVHRLLGVTPAPGGFVHHAGRPLAIDTLIVDEASMLDLALATRLLEAVPETARIVLLGDRDQLAAVESGAVFSELSVDPTLGPACIAGLSLLTGVPAALIQPPAAVHSSALDDSVVWFTRNFRFAADSGLGRLAASVNAGQAQPALDWLGSQRSGSDATVHWIDDAAAAPSPRMLQAMADGYAPFVAALRRDAADHRAIVDAFARFRVLCALREGPYGVQAINTELTRRLRAALRPGEVPDAPPWFAGRPVLVLRNDPVQKLFNGDIGITLADERGELQVWFANAEDGLRAIAPLRLPPHETAWAMTVHKSQGSEFERVLVLLPAQRSRVLTRELLYTAVTRARSSVTLCAGAAVLAATIAATTQRRSGLLARLREAAAPATGAPR